MGQVELGAQVDSLLAGLVSRAGRDDPYPIYAALQQQAPVARANDGSLLVTRFADCSAALRNPCIGHGDLTAGTEVAGLADWREHLSLRQFRTSMLSLDPPAHTRLRRLVGSAFTARRVAALQPAVERLTAELLEDLPSEADFIRTVAFPLPIAVIGELLGVPRADQHQFEHLAREWTQVLDVTTPRVLARADRAAGEIREYLAGLAAARRRRPDGALISALVQGEGVERLSEDEMLTMAALLFAAGFETATHLLGNGLVALLEHPDQLERWRRETDLGQSAVEELLRFDNSVQIARRTVLLDTVIGGVPVGAGQRVILCLGAANRDSARFSDPNRLDLARSDGGSLSFGGGIHYCLGAPLARLEAKVAFPALFHRFPQLRLREPRHRRVSLTLRGFLRLPVSFR